jgi:SM-20-related protein
MSPQDTPVAVFDEFLAPLELDWVHQFTAARAADFKPSHVIGPDRAGLADPRYRRSSVLYDLNGFHEMMGRRLMHFLPHIVYRLGLQAFNVSSIELQLTASNDGEFFRAHTDSDDGPVKTRTVTFVLFCHREPYAFSGGELWIYGRDPASGEHLTELRHTIRPAQNRMVLFPSDRLHEVTQVACPSGALLDSRFTLNGWLHR